MIEVATRDTDFKMKDDESVGLCEIVVEDGMAIVRTKETGDIRFVAARGEWLHAGRIEEDDA